MPNEIHTVGHSNKPGDFFSDLVVGAGIQRIVDVRTRPFSRYNPQFNQGALKASLESRGVEYVWHGNHLGGLDDNVDFDETLDELVADARDNDVVMALMCSEGSHKKCHRGDTLTFPLLNRGVVVKHLQQDGSLVVQYPSSGGHVPSPDSRMTTLF